MKENKYYTPSLDELYIGFECEKHDTYFNDSEPVSEYRQYIMCEEDFDMLSCYLTQYRIKHLDKQDLIELGFEEIGQEEYYLNGDLNSWCIEALYHQSIKSYYRIDDGETQRMFLEIKNKSELIKVLKMLGIK